MIEKSLVIIPTYNERDNAAPIAEAVLAAEPSTHILFVDDNSPDGTGEIIDQLCSQEDRIHVLHRKDKQGLGRAYIAGFQWALEQGYDLIMEMDADFSHNPQDVARLISAGRTADLVLGTRYKGGVRVINWPLSRLILSKTASYYVRWITGLPVTDPTGGFKCFRRAVLEEIDLEVIRSNGYSFQIEMTHTAWRKGFHIEEIPITFEERRVGHSKMNMAIVREALVMVWKLLFRAKLCRKPGPHHPRSIHPA